MTTYRVHTLDSAPAAAKPALEALLGVFGFIPNVAGVMASSPTLLGIFAGAFTGFHAGTFSEAEIQTLLLTNAVTNKAAWAVALHTMLALEQGVDRADVEAMRQGRARVTCRSSRPAARARAGRWCSLSRRRSTFPLRERNALLLAAGFAPMYLETDLAAPEMTSVRRALDAVLRQQQPYPALLLDRHWEILGTNDAAARFSRFFLGDKAASAPHNLLRRIFDPEVMRPHIANWTAVAGQLLQRVHREAVGGVLDPQTRALLSELLAYPGVPSSWREVDRLTAPAPVVPVSYVKGDARFDFFSTVTTLGTPQDITLQEIRIECFFPVDAATERAARELTAS